MNEPKKTASAMATWAVVAITVFAMVATVFYLQTLQVESLPVPAFTLDRMDEAADFSLQFTGLDGRTHSLEAYRGKTIVLNFWATWCAPCVRELPSLLRLADHYKDAPNVSVLCLSNEPPATIRRAMIGGGKAPMYSFDQLPALYADQGIPRTYVISPAGRLVFVQMGPADWSDASVFAFVDSLHAL